MTNHEVWQAVLGELELTISKANFTTWFKNTYIASIEDGKVLISVPTGFTKGWFEKKYSQTIAKIIQTITTQKIKEVQYRVDEHRQAPVAMQQNSFANKIGGELEKIGGVTVIERDKGQIDGRINNKYTFETFIVGKGNEMAHAAAMAVVDNPGDKYNPLFIYGGVGLGKTHLAQAVGNGMLAKNPKTKVLYVTCETFTNEFIHAIKTNKGKEFKDLYRNVDLLIIDDIHFLTGKDQTQEEFFHTFNSLHQNNKQVILTSDRQPKLIPTLEHRLISRFEWGMMADISNPDMETRIAILETKCKERNYTLDSEAINYIANVVQSNIRELEGALNKIIAYHQFKNLRPNLESVKSLLSSFSPSAQKHNVTPKHVIQTVSSYYDITINDLLGQCREKRFAFPRQIIMFLLRQELQISFPSIGNELGGRDHTTAMHATDKIRRELESNPKLRQDVDLIKQRLYNT